MATAGSTAPLSSDPIFRREFAKAMATGAGTLLGAVLLWLLLKHFGVIPDGVDIPTVGRMASAQGTIEQYQMMHPPIVG